MSLIAVGTLFPAIPLAIVALNFRYTSLAGLMRQITSQLEASTQDGPGEAVLIDELTVMKKRMTLVKYALFLCGVAFIFNLAALYLGYFSPGGLEPAMMADHPIDGRRDILFLCGDRAVDEGVEPSHFRCLAP